MSLTKPQKKFVIENCQYLTLFEMSDRIGIDADEISSYLKNNGLKPITTNVDLKQKPFEQKNEKSKMKPVWQILKENWKFLLGMVVFVFVLYANSLRGDFVSDDYATIVQNPEVTSISAALKTKFVATIYKTLIAAAFGAGSPVPFHFFSVVLYSIVCVLGFVLITNILNKHVAMATLIMFVVLPIHSEAVAWISGEPYLLTSIFILVFLNALVLFVDNKNKIYLLPMAISLLLLYFTDKFRGSSSLFLGYLYLFTYRNRLKLKVNMLTVTVVGACVFALIMFVSWPMIQTRVNAVNSGYNTSESVFYKPWEQYPSSITKYLQLMLLPTDLTLYHTMYTIPIWINWVVFLLYISAVVYFYFKNKDVFFALSFTFLAAAASMSPVKVSWLVAERYLFLGSLGFALFFVLFFRNITKKNLPLFMSLFSLLILSYSARTMFRNHDWRTNHLLWVATVQVSPNSHNAWNNIGDDYDKLSMQATSDNDKLFYMENSIKGFTQSVMAKPNYADAYHNRANIFFKAGRLDLARESYITAISYSPGLFQSYISLIQLEITAGDFPAAVKWSEKLLSINPNDAQSYYMVAMVYAQAGDIMKAKSLAEKSASLDPNSPYAKELLRQIELLISSGNQKEIK